MWAATAFLALSALTSTSASPSPKLDLDDHPRLVSRAQYINTASQTLSDDAANLIMNVMNQDATASWEIGVHAEALTEYTYPSLSVFASGSIPPPSSPVASPVLNIASNVVAGKVANTLPFMPDGSAADPASIGQAVLLANWTIGQANYTLYNTAAQQELYFLLNVAPKTPDGAISHRIEQTQLWSDSVYMVPPYLAYYGALTNNATLLQAAYDQIRLYRNYLGLPNNTAQNGLWKHQALGTTPDDNDNGAWATGNGWAAAGIVRVLATILNSGLAAQFTTQCGDLAAWAQEILVAAWESSRTDNLFLNYFNGSIYSSAVFPDAASTALLTAASYRLGQMLLTGSSSSILPSTSPFAPTQFNATSDLMLNITRSRLAVYTAVNNKTGIVNPAVDPINYKASLNDTTASPEAQAFVLLMEAAFTDFTGPLPNLPGYVASGPVGGAMTFRNMGPAALVAAILVGGFALL